MVAGLPSTAAELCHRRHWLRTDEEHWLRAACGAPFRAWVTASAAAAARDAAAAARAASVAPELEGSVWSLSCSRSNQGGAGGGFHHMITHRLRFLGGGALEVQLALEGLDAEIRSVAGREHARARL